MPSIAIRATNSRFTYASKAPTTDVRSSLIGEYIFGGTQANSTPNPVNSAAPLTLAAANTEAVVYGTNFATVKHTAGFDTGIPLELQGNYTVIQVTKNSLGAIGAKQYYFGTLRYDADRICLYNSQYGTVENVADLAVKSDGAFYFLAAKMPYAGKGKLYRYEDGVLVTNEGEVNGGARSTTDTWRIGSDVTGTASIFSPVDIAYAAIYNSLLSDAEIADAYLDIKAYLSDYRGLSIS